MSAASSAGAGERAQYDLGVTLQHVSNGGIKRPNNGLTFSALALR